MAWQLPGIPARPSSPLSPLRSCCALLALLALLVPFLPAAADAGPTPGRAGPASVGRSGQQGGEAAPGGMLSLIVRERDPASTQAEHLVAQAGGIVTRALPIIGGFAARVPADHLSPLLGSPAVQHVWPDGPMRVRGLDRAGHGGAAPAGGGPAGASPAGAAPGTHDSLPAETVWRTAIGLDRVGPGRHPATVALLDTGVTTTPDLGHRVLARVDLTEEHDGLDRYGHGTHLAGVIAGNGELADGRAGGARGGGYQGAAPGARLVSVKVASGNGATDVSVVLAGLQWVVSNRARFGIRILNLSFGTDSTQSYLVDPLDFAVERVWQAGILAVVAAGNDGELGSPSVRKPGDDPFVLTVGAADLNNTSTTGDDTVAPFSSRGSTPAGVGKPDLVAPGVSIVGLRAPGSTIDRFQPAARHHGHYLKGTGTSQATAVVSGVAALLYEHDPGLRPDVAKAALLDTAQRHLAGRPGAGAGLVDAAAAVAAVARGTYRSRPANQGLRPSDGRGSLQASRGTLRAYTDLDGDGTPEPVAGEVDALGRTWDAAAWTATPWTPATWSASPWSRLVAESPGRGTERWGGDTWSGLGHDARTWYIKHWGGLPEDPAAWHIKHWGVEHWGIQADRPGPGSIKHWTSERWSSERWS